MVSFWLYLTRTKAPTSAPFRVDTAMEPIIFSFDDLHFFPISDSNIQGPKTPSQHPPKPISGPPNPFPTPPNQFPTLFKKSTFSKFSTQKMSLLKIPHPDIAEP